LTEGTTQRAPLAGSSREDWIHARCDGVPVSARTGTFLLPRWSPHPSLWCCSAPSSSTICQPEPSHCASLSTQHVRLSVVLSTMPAWQPGTRCLMNLDI